ncbi:MAG: uL22 family ribosomal protein, partial [Candidatus Micrarchaeota archaeon]
MKGYSSNIPENCACARLESVNASYKDLSQVCGRIRSKKTGWALVFLEKAADGEIPVLYNKHNRNLGHRRELGGRKGRYPKKAAAVVLKLLRSAIANGHAKGLGSEYTIFAASANKKEIYPRMASKGRQARSYLETSRIEIVLQGPEAPKGVSVTPPKKEEPKKEAAKGSKSAAAKPETSRPEAAKAEPA